MRKRKERKIEQGGDMYKDEHRQVHQKKNQTETRIMEKKYEGGRKREREREREREKEREREVKQKQRDREGMKVKICRGWLTSWKIVDRNAKAEICYFRHQKWLFFSDKK